MGNKIYKYKTEKETYRYFPEFKDLKFESEWLKIYKGRATVKKGYAWNGCSPKFKIFGKIYGTWDGENDEAKTATLWHDAFYQYSLSLKYFGVDRFDVDSNFAKDLASDNFKYPFLYFIAVRMFGWITWYHKRKY
jgi:hypothetical protein